MNVERIAAVLLIAGCIGSLHATDVTFVVASDLHYDSDTANASNVSGRATIADINAVAGVAYPSSIGGGVASAPQFVALCGDICNGYTSTDSILHRQFSLFTADWGLSGEKLLHCPVYEGLGNHDELYSPYIINSVIARNATRSGTNVSSNGLHYSWNTCGVHFIQANLFAGNDANDTSNQESPPRNSLAFVIDDLKANVGASGMPVVIFQHYGWDDFSFLDNEGGVDHLGRWWTAAQSDYFYNAVKDYNVVGVFWGHTHAVAFRKWNNTIDVYNDGSTKGETFLVVHIGDTTMTVANRYRTSWVGGNVQKKRIAVGPPVATKNSGLQKKDQSGRVNLPAPQYVASSRQLFVSLRASSSGVRPAASLVNMMGKVVKSANDIRYLPGEDRLSIDCSNLARGVYYVRIEVGNEHALRFAAIR
jgi:hypothetical protein